MPLQAATPCHPPWPLRFLPSSAAVIFLPGGCDHGEQNRSKSAVSSEQDWSKTAARHLGGGARKSNSLEIRAMGLGIFQVIGFFLATACATPRLDCPPCDARKPNSLEIRAVSERLWHKCHKRCHSDPAAALSPST